jgi:hypothetical protein
MATDSTTSLWDLFLSLFFENVKGRQQVKWSTYQAFAIMVGLVMLIIYSASSSRGWQAFSICLFAAGASLAMGLLVGFLFGVPRAGSPKTGGATVTPDAGGKTDAAVTAVAGANLVAGVNADVGVKPDPGANVAANAKPDTVVKPDATDGGKPKGVYSANTNLEQISDWLTKIIVGVGLVQLTVIPGKLRSLADYLATAFGTPAVPSALVMTIIFYFGIFGFLLGYLWARLYLMGEFEELG